VEPCGNPAGPSAKTKYSLATDSELVFSFTQWSGQIPTEFHVLHGTWVHNYQTAIQFKLQDFHPLRLLFPKTFIYCIRPTQHIVPAAYYVPLPSYCNAHTLTQHKFYSSFRFAHHYSGNQLRFLFLALLRCFSSCRSLLYPIYSDKDD